MKKVSVVRWNALEQRRARCFLEREQYNNKVDWLRNIYGAVIAAIL